MISRETLTPTQDQHSRTLGLAAAVEETAAAKEKNDEDNDQDGRHTHHLSSSRAETPWSRE